MTVHYAFTRPRSAVVPSLFPAGMDALLSERRAAYKMGDRIVHGDTDLPFHLARVLGDFERRIEARMAQVAK